MEIKDSLDLLDWRNEALARKFSRSQELISENAHDVWLISRLARIQQEPFLIFENDLGKIGFVRFDLRENLQDFIISIGINPMHRGKGFGRLTLNYAIEACVNQNPGADYFAEVQKDNFNSIRLFLESGFDEISRDDNFLLLQRTYNPQ